MRWRIYWIKTYLWKNATSYSLETEPKNFLKLLCNYLVNIVQKSEIMTKPMVSLFYIKILAKP